MAKAKRTAQLIALHPTRDIPFNQLELSAANVRSVLNDASIPDLADSIARRGLLQSLNVRPILDDDGAETGRYTVPAGGRRFRALTLLVKQKRLAADAPIPCIVKSDGLAEDDSLAENSHREALHPLDEFRAFESMRKAGRSDDDIAAAYHVTPAVVRQRRRLANASPLLLDAYVADDIDLKQLMAFCLTDNHDRQEAAYTVIKGRPSYNRGAWDIKRLITETTVPASDGRALYVGLTAYEAAGGAVMRNLFEEKDHGYLQDADLLNRLVDKKLSAERERFLAAGWKWAVAAVDLPYSERQGLLRLKPLDVQRTAKQQKRLTKLETERDMLSELDEHTDEQSARLDVIDAEIDDLENPTPTFEREDMARAGVFITIDDDTGELDADYGFVKPEDHVAEEGADADGHIASGNDDDDGEGSEFGEDEGDRGRARSAGKAAVRQSGQGSDLLPHASTPHHA